MAPDENELPWLLQKAVGATETGWGQDIAQLVKHVPSMREALGFDPHRHINQARWHLSVTLG